MSNPPTFDCFAFGGFRLDRRRRELTAPDGSQVGLTAKAFDTLVYLLEHPGQVIERSTLLDVLWPNTVVEENNLSQAVAALRRTLGEGFIVTVPRRGYQFVAAVRPVAGPIDASAPMTAPAHLAGDEGTRGGFFRRRWLYALAVLATVGAAVFTMVRDDTTRSPGSGGTPLPTGGTDPDATPTVAVLPCRNLSPDPDDAYFAAGIHEEILNQLTKLSGIRVIARAAVMQYANDRPPIPEIADALHAGGVLECSVRYAGSEIMVTAQLIDPGTGGQIWSNSYPGDLADLAGVFAMQADIATNIARALDAELSPAETRRLDLPSTTSPEAYVELLRAVDAGAEDGMEHLDRAIELDPDFGFAYAMRGLAHLNRALLADTSTEAAYDFVREVKLAIDDADRALAIDDEIGLAHIVSGARYAFPGADTARMQAAVERAVDLSPHDIGVLFLAAGWYLANLRLDDAHVLLERIMRLDPSAGLHGPTRNVGQFLLLAGDPEGAADFSRRYLRQDPTGAGPRLRIAFNELVIGNDGEALRNVRLAEQLLADEPGGQAYALAYLGVYVYGRLGRSDDARRLFDRFLAPAHDDDLLPMMWSIAYLGLGEVEKAYEAATVMTHRPRVPWPGPWLWLALNPMHDPALERPEFLELRRVLGYRSGQTPGQP